MSVPQEPKYVSMDERDREAFLSQNGSFLPSERVVFHGLCNIWQKKISYVQAVNVVNKLSTSSLNDFQLLMNKLRSRGLGMIRTTIHERSQTPDYIVLADEWSPFFVYEMLAEWLVSVQMYSKQKLPTASALNQQKLTIPPELTKQVTYPEALNLFEKAKARQDTEDEEVTILKLPMPSSDALYVGDGQFFQMLNIIILKIKNEFRNPELLAKLARATDKGVMELKSQLQGKDIPFWKWLVNIISTHEDWKQNTEMLQCVYFLQQYLMAQEINQEEQQHASEKREEQFRLVLESIRLEQSLIIPISAMEVKLQEYKEAYQEGYVHFREEFVTRFVKPITSENLPFLLGINEQIIHRDNICKYFLSKFYELGGILKRECTKNLHSELGGKTGNANTFKSPSHFEQFVRHEVHTRDIFVYAILERPLLLATIIAHHFKSMRKSKPQEFNLLLERFFNTKEMMLRPYVKIFDLVIEDIFEIGYKKLSFFQRIWFRMNGQYNVRKAELNWSEKNEDLFAATPSEEEEELLLKQQKKSRLSRILVGEGPANHDGGAPLKMSRENNKSSLLQKKPEARVDEKKTDELWADFKQAIHAKDKPPS